MTITTVLLIVIAALLFCLMILLHEFGHFITAKLCGIRVNEFALGMGPKLFKIQKKETLYTLRLFPIGGFCAMEGENGESEDPRAFGSKAVWKRMIVVSAGGVMNILLGLVLMFVVVVQQPAYSSTTIAEFTEDAATQASGLRVDDTFYSIDGYRTYTARDVTYALSMADAADVKVVVLRDGETVTLPHVRLQTQVEDGAVYPVIDFRVYPIGRSVGSVLGQTFSGTVSYTRMVWSSLSGIITGRVSLNSLSGPIGTASAIGQVASASTGVDLMTAINNIILLMVILTINLGIINLLPLPALDGGRLLLLLIEAIRRKPLNPKYEQWIHGAGFLALMIFMVLISVQDILRIFS